MTVAAAVSHPRLSRAVARAVRRARSRGEALVAVTVPAPGMDPAQVALASRRPGEPYFLFEQPDRDRHALAALGCVRALEASGPDRFARVGREWRGGGAGGGGGGGGRPAAAPAARPLPP